MAGAGSYIYVTNTATAGELADTEPPLQTAVVRQGELTISATGAGTIIAANEVDLSFQTNGRLAKLPVQVGDAVRTGDLLAPPG